MRPGTASVPASANGAPRVSTIAICTSGGAGRAAAEVSGGGGRLRPPHDHPRSPPPSPRPPQRPPAAPPTLPLRTHGRAAAAARSAEGAARGGICGSQGPGGRSSSEAEGGPRHSGREGSIGPGPSRGTGQRGEASGDAGRPSRRARRRSTPQPGATTTSSTSTARRGRAPSTSPPSPSPPLPAPPSRAPRGAAGVRACVAPPGWVWRKCELLGARRLICHTSSESRGENLGVRGGIAKRAPTARARRGYVAHLALSRRS